MSSPIHCPEQGCGALVTETGWGDEAGEYECKECGTEFVVGDGEGGTGIF